MATTTLLVCQRPLGCALRLNVGSISSRKCSSLFLGHELEGLKLSCTPAAPGRTLGGGRKSLLIAAAANDKEDAPKKKKMPSAVKRALLSEKRRIYNKSRKSEIRTRMKKVFTALDELKKKSSDAQPEELKPVEVLIGEAYSVIDKAVKVRTLHKNTGRRRKSRLARAKKILEISLGWYTPVSETPVVATAAAAT